MIEDGKGAYGTVHVMEDEMRAAEQGVFEPKSGLKSERASANKMAKKPANKSKVSE